MDLKLLSCQIIIIIFRFINLNFSNKNYAYSNIPILSQFCLVITFGVRLTFSIVNDSLVWRKLWVKFWIWSGSKSGGTLDPHKYLSRDGFLCFPFYMYRSTDNFHSLSYKYRLAFYPRSWRKYHIKMGLRNDHDQVLEEKKKKKVNTLSQ